MPIINRPIQDVKTNPRAGDYFRTDSTRHKPFRYIMVLSVLDGGTGLKLVEYVDTDVDFAIIRGLLPDFQRTVRDADVLYAAHYPV